MATVFDSLSDGFYTAFFEPEPEKRKEKIDRWIKESTPMIQSAVEGELRRYIDGVLEGTWELNGWKSRAHKFLGSYFPPTGLKKGMTKPDFIDTYKLNLECKIVVPSRKQENVVIDSLPPEVRAKTMEAIDRAKTFIAGLEVPKPIAIREIDLHGKTLEEALVLVGDFIKECYRDNVRRVRIIHGKGIFVLQKGIRGFLETHRLVKPGTICAAGKDQGGEGATEAELEDFSATKL